LISAATAEFQKTPRDDPPGHQGRKTIVFQAPGLFLRDDATKVVYPILRAFADVHYEVIEELVPFKLVSYTEENSGELITDAAIADMKIAGVPGKVVVVYKEQEGGHVLFVPDRKDGAQPSSGQVTGKPASAAHAKRRSHQTP
jgi:hypothetical protein